MMHTELDVWKKSMDVTEHIYIITKEFPKIEHYTLARQTRRAALSIPSNIAEGASRRTTKDYLRFLYIALGSSSELETQCMLSKRLTYYDFDCEKDLTSVKRMLTAMIKSLEKGNKIK
tara:strand:+ start:847 stop:1200 length:354 start_codon:yes stop_codon:yes gene_type:complete